MEPFIIEVDGLPVEVDEDEYRAAPDAVIEGVQQLRAAHVGTLDDEPAPDYDTLDAIAAHEMGL